jgi:hypothetical protein
MVLTSNQQDHQSHYNREHDDCCQSQRFLVQKFNERELWAPMLVLVLEMLNALIAAA